MKKIKFLILGGVVFLLLGMPCLKYNGSAPGMSENNPAFSQGLSISGSEIKRRLTSVPSSLAHAWNQVVANLHTAYQTHILQTEKKAILTENAVRGLTQYLSP